MAFVLLPCDLPTWKTVQEHLNLMTSVTNPQEFVEIFFKLYEYCNVGINIGSFESPSRDIFVDLVNFLQECDLQFFEKILPSMVKYALQIGENRPPQGLTYLLQYENHELELPRPFVASLLSHVFFCTMPRRSVHSHPTLTDPCLARVLSSLGQQNERIKLRSFLNYFLLVSANDSLTDSIKFSRQSINSNSSDAFCKAEWEESHKKLCPFVFSNVNEYEDLWSKNQVFTTFTSSDILGLSQDSEQITATAFNYPEMLVSSIISEHLELGEVFYASGLLRSSTICYSEQNPSPSLMDVPLSKGFHNFFYSSNSSTVTKENAILNELQKAFQLYLAPNSSPLAPNLSLDSSDILSVSRQHSETQDSGVQKDKNYSSEDNSGIQNEKKRRLKTFWKKGNEYRSQEKSDARGNTKTPSIEKHNPENISNIKNNHEKLEQFKNSKTFNVNSLTVNNKMDEASVDTSMITETPKKKKKNRKNKRKNRKSKTKNDKIQDQNDIVDIRLTKKNSRTKDNIVYGKPSTQVTLEKENKPKKIEEAVLNTEIQVLERDNGSRKRTKRKKKRSICSPRNIFNCLSRSSTKDSDYLTAEIGTEAEREEMEPSSERGNFKEKLKTIDTRSLMDRVVKAICKIESEKTPKNSYEHDKESSREDEFVIVGETSIPDIKLDHRVSSLELNDEYSEINPTADKKVTGKPPIPKLSSLKQNISSSSKPWSSRDSRTMSTNRQVSFLSATEDEMYYSALESFEVQEAGPKTSYNSKDVSRKATFAQRLKETLSRGESGESNAKEDRHASVSANPSSLYKDLKMIPNPSGKILRKISGEISFEEEEKMEMFSSRFQNVTQRPPLLSHESSRATDQTSPDDYEESRSQLSSVGDVDSNQEQRDSNCSSRYSFSSDYSTDKSEIYEFVEDILMPVEEELTGPRRVAVRKFSKTIRKRALSDSFKGLAVSLGGIAYPRKSLFFAKWFPRRSKSEKSFQDSGISSCSNFERQKFKNTIPSVVLLEASNETQSSPDFKLRVLLHWAAASNGNISRMHFQCLDKELKQVIIAIQNARWTVGRLVAFLFDLCSSSDSKSLLDSLLSRNSLEKS